MSGVKVTLDDLETILKRRGLEERGRVQRYIDSEVIRYSEPYTPRRLGALSRSAKTGTVEGSGEVVWNDIKARFQYYGKLMVSPTTGSSWAKKNEKKVLTDRDLEYHGGGMRGKMWFERMKLDHKDDIIRGAAEIAGGKPK